METEGTGSKSFLIRDLLRDLIVKKPEISDETSDNDDSGKTWLRDCYFNPLPLGRSIDF